MKTIIYILTSFTCLVGCKSSIEKDQKLEPGMYYLNRNLSNDTLFFQSNKPKSIIRDWGLKKWKITEDSVLRFDDRGILTFSGMDKCSYSVKQDTLILEYNSPDTDGAKRKKEIEKYLVIETTKISLTLDPIYGGNSKKTHTRLDIQL